MIGGLVLLFGLDQLMLLGFLGHAGWPMALAGGGAVAAIAGLIARGVRGAVPLRRLAACAGIALALLALGGEGNFFYANVDWQVRGAALADMIRAPWPFVYGGKAGPLLLRAPLGMYLLPALLGKAGGSGAGAFALLVQNAAVLTILLALGSLLFETRRARHIALVVLLCFSGMDTIGALIVRPDILWPLDVHIEGWLRLQYSSMLTLAFWVPQHAISGWLGGLLFLLWRRRFVSLASYLAIVPLVALWSPLGVMGTVPFCALAACHTLIDRKLRMVDIGLPLLAALLAVPGLAYMGTDAGRVGAHLVAIPPLAWIIFEMIEIIPLLACGVALGAARRVGCATIVLVAACLALMPFLQIGENVDFMMRASIPALLILAIAIAELLATALPGRWRSALCVVLAIGALTPARELLRALIYLPPPAGRCDVAAAWRESFADFGANTYFARPGTLPASLRPASPTVLLPTAGSCYDRPWKMPRATFLPQPVRRSGVID